MFVVLIIGTDGGFPESRLDKLYKHLQKHKETKHEGREVGTNGEDEDDSTFAAEPIKKLFIVSSSDNKTIIETIETEEERKDFIKRSRIKRRRLQSRPAISPGREGKHLHETSTQL